MSKSCIVIRHLMFEGLGTFAAPLQENGYAIRYLEAGVDALAPAAEADLLVVLGGPIGAYDEAIYPFLHDEFALLDRRLAADAPTLGICLGAQLMARSLGARVYPGPDKEIGWQPLTLTAAGEDSPLRHIGGLQTSMLHWHGDTFDLPAGCELLASTPLCTQQAFRRGKRQLGLQFHPEFDARHIEQWLVGHTCELGSARIDIPALRADTAQHGERLANQSRRFFAEWLQGLQN